MVTKITETDTLGVLCKLLAGIEMTDNVKPKSSNYTAKGCETILEYKGIFYRISVEALESPRP